MDSSKASPGSSKSRAVKCDFSLYSRLPHLANCVLCYTTLHTTWDCILKPPDKMERIKRLGLCLNCLVSDHKSYDCPNTGNKCKDCGLCHYDFIFHQPGGWYFDPVSGSYQPTIPKDLRTGSTEEQTQHLR